MEFGTVAAELHNSAAQNGAEQSFPAGLKVLLCESQHNSADTAVLLQQLDYQVTQAADEQQAACKLQGISSPYDVILADAAVLGSGTVFEAARSSGVAVVAMTHEHSSSAEVMAAVQAGAADVLERPLCHSKLQNIWQHTVRASLTSSKSAGTKHSTLSTQHDNPTLHAQHQQQAATPRAGAAAAAGTPKHSPMCFSLLDDCLLHGLDGLGGLELPPLVPSQLEFEPLDSILSDMQQAEEASAAPMMGLLGGVLPPGSPSTSNAGTVVAASLFGSHSSEQQCNDDTDIAAAELESSADASSAGWPQNRRRKCEWLADSPVWARVVADKHPCGSTGQQSM
jgi:CheY-like chemotaxis protein